MDADSALIQAWDLGMDEGDWTDAVMEKAELLLPILIEAWYAAVDEDQDTWWFTAEGVKRADQIEGLKKPDQLS